MRKCSYCGAENGDEGDACQGCGCNWNEPKRLSIRNSSNSLSVPRLISLVCLGVASCLFFAFAALNLFLALELLARPNPTAASNQLAFNPARMFQSAFANGVIAVLCIVSWLQLHKCKSERAVGSVVCIVCAFLITLLRWIHSVSKGYEPYVWAEPVLFWPWLLIPMVSALFQFNRNAPPSASDKSSL